jgi:hypothetical protein
MAIAIQAGSNMAMILANTGGGLQTLPNQMVGAKPHIWTERFTLASQASGVNIPVARIPFGSILLGILINGTVSLGTSTVAFGDMNNTARFKAAAVFTAVDTATQVLNAASQGAALTTCYDSIGVDQGLRGRHHDGRCGGPAGGRHALRHDALPGLRRLAAPVG